MNKKKMLFLCLETHVGRRWPKRVSISLSIIRKQLKILEMLKCENEEGNTHGCC